MKDHLIPFPVANGYTAFVPMSTGVAWYGANGRLWIVSLTRNGRKRYAVCRDNGKAIAYVYSMEEARAACQRETGVV